MIVVMGDLNVKVGNNNVNREDGSLRAGSLGVLFARVSLWQNRDLRASERAKSPILLAGSLRSPTCKSQLRRQDTRANNTPSEPARRLRRWGNGDPDRPCHSEWSYETIITGHESDWRSRRI